MDPNDLLKMLDLDGKPPDTPRESGLVAASTEPTPPADASPTALAVDAWGLHRGRDLVAESDRLRQAGTDEFAAADFFSAAFDPDPRLVESCADPRRHRFVAQLLDTPEYHALHAATRLDDTAAAIAAAHFAEQFAQLNKEEEKDDPGGATPGSGDALADEMATLRAVGRAVAAADKEVTEMREAAGALGMGPGEPGSNDPVAVAALFKRVRTDPTLRRICELAGRFRRVAQSKQRQKVTHGLDDVVGVEPGGDIGRLLPSELARLMLPRAGTRHAAKDRREAGHVPRAPLRRAGRQGAGHHQPGRVGEHDRGEDQHGQGAGTRPGLGRTAAEEVVCTGRVQRRQRRTAAAAAAGPVGRTQADGVAFGVHRLRVTPGCAGPGDAPDVRRPEGAARRDRLGIRDGCAMPYRL